MGRRVPNAETGFEVALAIRVTLGLVVTGAIIIGTYGYFVVGGARRIQPRVREDAHVVEALAASILRPCLDGFAFDPIARSALATSGRTRWASGECGFERDVGSGVAARTVSLHAFGSREAITDDWSGDVSSLRCATSTTETCSAILTHRTHPEWVRLITVRRIPSGDGWTRVEAIVELR